MTESIRRCRSAVFIKTVSSVDKSDCGKLYLCEISAAPESERLAEDNKTLALLMRTYNEVGGQLAGLSNYQIISKFLS